MGKSSDRRSSATSAAAATIERPTFLSTTGPQAVNIPRRGLRAIGFMRFLQRWGVGSECSWAELLTTPLLLLLLLLFSLLLLLFSLLFSLLLLLLPLLLPLLLLLLSL